LDRCGNGALVDLGSGAAGPVAALAGELAEGGASALTAILTDKYPNLAAFARVTENSGGRIGFVSRSVDATAPPMDLAGFRTMFSAFHHFPPPAARAILQDAVDRGSGIGVFEYTERSWIWFLVLPLLPVCLWLALPFVLRPFGWRQALWIYVLPVLVLALAWDGLVSCLRTYSPEELRRLTEGLTGGGYDWEIGRERSFGACRITYLIGTPATGGAMGPR
jgi:hypothetical protein